MTHVYMNSYVSVHSLFDYISDTPQYNMYWRTWKLEIFGSINVKRLRTVFPEEESDFLQGLVKIFPKGGGEKWV